MALIYLWTKVGITLLSSRIRLVKSGFKETLVSFTRLAIYLRVHASSISAKKTEARKKNPPRIYNRTLKKV